MKQLLLTLALLVVVCSQPSMAAEKAADPKAPPKPAPATISPQIQVFTSMGNFTIELNQERAPLTVTNILAYVDSGHYTNTLIHRVVASFVIQGGGFNVDYTAKAAPLRVNNESGNGLSNVRGTVGLARGQDPHGGNCQFYVNLNDNAALDPNATRWGYAVFGRVIDGMDVVDRIGNVATGKHGAIDETPIKPVVILKIERVGAASGSSGAAAPKP
ncbi:MAG TPA: peptidylprolyl isomerase [Steroidobacteraceae bacterium]|jgi:cyclophilin family peptidyl-prolyl cis-trans isomerase|nr:peptidylprolyl isomerase [Steroidobacteraceae bacterium]